MPWSKPSEHIDEEGNRIQRRHLKDERTFDVVKNFPTREELEADVAPFAKETTYRVFENCGVKGSGRWCMRYVTNG